MFKFHNANSRGRFVNDCTVRAISVAEGKTWDETYDELSDIAQDEGNLFDAVEFVEGYLDRRYKRVPIHEHTVGEFAEAHPIGTYLVTMPSHITVVVNGVVYDIFDCRHKVIWSAWKVNRRSRF